MQAVILAAGKSTRTHPLTLTRPKPLLKVAGRTILEHNLIQLEGLIDEAILVVGYKKEMIEERIGGTFQGIRVSYIEQAERLGTGHALLQAEARLKGRFLVLHGDDLYSRQDIQACLKHPHAVLGKEVPNPSDFGVLVTEKNRLKDIIEKPAKPSSRLANTALYVLDTGIFNMLKKLPKTKRGEYELTDAVKQFAKGTDVIVERAGSWHPVSYPWSLLDANKAILDSLKKPDIRGKLERNVTINGTITVGEGTVIKSGAYIEGNLVIGKNCQIGPNCHLRGPTSIGDNCRIGQSSEIKASIIGDNSNVPHLSYLGDSILGNDCNFACGSVTANLRHDKGSIKSLVKGKMVDTGRRKFGTVIGDGVKTGIGTLVYPGRKIWPGKTTKPGEVVKQDLV
ncbi:MAG: bifunctional sugar-1-phosphate nucleotidylyltransferase/acetyltransferase [Candidatus Aenigmatarchaeota archaeon]